MTSLARLKVRRDFLDAAKGLKYVRRGLVLQALDKSVSSKAGTMRYGLTVTKKVGNAVTRNRIRRRLRAVATELLPELGRSGFDYVLIGRVTTLDRPYAQLVKDLETALARVHDMASQPKFASVEETAK